ncbi:MAG: hypothetical protein WC378_20425, partial [Opitutaceae bacterium]
VIWHTQNGHVALRVWADWWLGLTWHLFNRKLTEGRVMDAFERTGKKNETCRVQQWGGDRGETRN